MSNIILAIDPVSKPRMTQSDRWRSRPCTQKYWDFKDRLKLLYGNNQVPESLHLIFTIQMPKSWSNKKRLAMTGKPHQSKPDIDNLIKAFLDALLDDDAHVWDIRATKVWGTDGSIEVRDLADDGE